MVLHDTENVMKCFTIICFEILITLTLVYYYYIFFTLKAHKRRLFEYEQKKHTNLVIKKISSLLTTSKVRRPILFTSQSITSYCVSSFISAEVCLIPCWLLLYYSIQIKTEKVLCDMFLLIGILLLVFMYFNVQKKAHTRILMRKRKTNMTT